MQITKLGNGLYQVGGEELFKEIFQKYGDKVYNLLLSRCKDQLVARELLRSIFQEVYEQIMQATTVDITEVWLKSLAEVKLAQRRMGAAQTTPSRAVPPQAPPPQAQPQPVMPSQAPAYAAMPQQAPPQPMPQQATPLQATPLQTTPLQTTPQQAEAGPTEAPFLAQMRQAATQQAAPQQSAPPMPSAPPENVVAYPFAAAQAVPQAVAQPVPQAMPQAEAQQTAQYQEPKTLQTPKPAMQPTQTFPGIFPQGVAYEPYIPGAEAKKKDAGKEKKRNIGRIAIIVGLSVMILITLWMIVGLLMDLQVLPEVDLGYKWFNDNLMNIFWIVRYFE